MTAAVKIFTRNVDQTLPNTQTVDNASKSNGMAEVNVKLSLYNPQKHTKRMVV
jgi:hypothetical protein